MFLLHFVDQSIQVHVQCHCGVVVDNRFGAVQSGNPSTVLMNNMVYRPLADCWRELMDEQAAPLADCTDVSKRYHFNDTILSDDYLASADCGLVEFWPSSAMVATWGVLGTVVGDVTGSVFDSSGVRLAILTLL